MALVCKSLLGKAHTVMAEGGMAAAMGNVWPEDNWQVHFRDTMRGGKMLNNWRMAQLHAQEAPDRVYELERWGALFDRTKDGRITQRDFGGHRYARLAHVGDRTGLELIRTLQQKAVSMGIDVFMECKILRLLPDAEGRISGAVGYMRPTGEMVLFTAKAFVLATGSIGKSWKYTSNSWESVGDGHAMAIWAGADVIDMECVQFHPTGMVWPLSVRGILVTEGVRGDGGVLRNSEGKRFMFDYVADMFRAETAETEEEADALVRGPHQQPAHARPAAARRGGPGHQLRGEGGPGQPPRRRLPRHRLAAHAPSTSGGACPPCTTSSWSWPASTSRPSPWRSGPTCHYMMGGVRVDAETQAATVPGLFAAGEVAGGMHGANRLGGNSLSDLLVFGRRAGIGRRRLRRGPHRLARASTAAEVDSVIDEALAPSDARTGTTPTTSSTSCRRPCSRWSASSAPGPSSRRRWPSWRTSSSRRPRCRSRAAGPTTRAGTWPPTCRPCSPPPSPWPRAPSTARSPGAGTPGRTTPGPTPSWARSTSCSTRRASTGTWRPIAIAPEPLPEMPAELRALFEEGH